MTAEETVTTERQLFTSSRARSFRGCQRQHHIRYVQGYVPLVPRGALRFGTVYHSCLESYWRFDTEAALKKSTSEFEGIDPFARAKLRAMVFAYCTGWDVRRVGYIERVLDVERQYRLPMINPNGGHASRTFDRAGKVDVLVLMCDGRLAVMEHKSSATSAEPGTEYRHRLLLDPQVSEYQDAVFRADGYTNRGADVVLYDVGVKPGQEPYKATPEEQRKYTQPKSRVCPECKRKKNAVPAPHIITDVDEETGEETNYECADGRIVTDPGGVLYANLRERDETPEEYEARCLGVINQNYDKYFQVIEVVRLESERREYLLDVWNIAQQARVSERTGIAPRNPDACFRYGSPCDFWDVCTGTATLDDVSRFKKIDSVNPELSEGRVDG